MGLFSNQFANVVEWEEYRDDIIFWKWTNREIKKDSKLIIKPGQDAIFLYNGAVEGIFTESGSYTIDSQIIPFLSKRRSHFRQNLLSIRVFPRCFLLNDPPLTALCAPHRFTNSYCIICNLLCFLQPVTAFTAHHNPSQPALIYHSFSRPISACLDLSQLIITYHNPQRFIAVRVIVYPLLILTYKFTKINRRKRG